MFQILVVDDDRHTRMLLEAILKAENYTVFTADNGVSTLEVLDREHVDLVVLDIMMPKMDGYEFTKLLRETNNDLPILMVSARQRRGPEADEKIPKAPCPSGGPESQRDVPRFLYPDRGLAAQ